MYDQYLKVVTIKNKKTVITTAPIPSNIPICEFGGELYTDKELAALGDKININNVLQIGPNLYIGPSGRADDYIRHSCNPNCFVHASGRRAVLYSLYVIPTGGELTFDYSSTATDDVNTWKMDCTCGDINCRKVISGFQYLNSNLQNEYKKKGIAALFISEPIFMRK